MDVKEDPVRVLFWCGGRQQTVSIIYMENHPVEEIAAVTGLSESNVKVKLHRIRKKLYLIIKEMP